jgi:hypothetical protein
MIFSVPSGFDSCTPEDLVSAVPRTSEENVLLESDLNQPAYSANKSLLDIESLNNTRTPELSDLHRALRLEADEEGAHLSPGTEVSIRDNSDITTKADDEAMDAEDYTKLVRGTNMLHGGQELQINFESHGLYHQ